MTKLRTLHRDRGFTLVELLVVVVIIGILIAIAIPLYLNFKQGAYDASAKSDIQTLRLEERNYNANNPSFGTTNQLLAANPHLTMSSGTVAAVVWSSATSYCVAVVNVHGDHDSSAPLASLGFPYKTYFYDSDIGKISTDACTQPSDATGLDGYIDNSGS